MTDMCRSSNLWVPSKSCGSTCSGKKVYDHNASETYVKVGDKRGEEEEEEVHGEAVG